MRIYRAKNCGYFCLGLFLSRHMLNSSGSWHLSIELGNWHFSIELGPALRTPVKASG
jgi:hypothetical protein